MKISSPKKIDLGDFPEVQEELEPIFEILNGASDEVSSALQGRLTFGDNFLSETIYVTLSQGEEETVSLQVLTEAPTQAFLVDTAQFDYARLAWRAEGAGNVTVKVKWDEDPGDPVLTQIVFFGA